MTYCWSQAYSYQQTVQECRFGHDQHVGEETVADWFSYCREVAMIALDSLYTREGRIGGPGHVVEIEETKMGKRIYNVGRMVEGSWILGMIEVGAGEALTSYRLEICPGNRRDAATLIPLIEKHVAPGTTIITDLWAGYSGLEGAGYNHLTVNHTYNFVDPDTYAHTQHIESSWRPFKKKLTSTGFRKRYLADHMCEFLWRREVRRNNNFFFESLIRDIGQIDNW